MKSQVSRQESSLLFLNRFIKVDSHDTTNMEFLLLTHFKMESVQWSSFTYFNAAIWEWESHWFS